MFVISTLKTKLQYDFETLIDRPELLNMLKTSLFAGAKKYTAIAGMARNICTCIAYEAIHGYWANFIEEIAHFFSDSLEGIAIALTILKVV